jgi:hypothetical protein
VSTRRQRRDRRHARDRLLATLGANLACGYGVHDSEPDPEQPGYTVCTRCGAVYPERPPVPDLPPTNAAEYALRFYRKSSMPLYGDPQRWGAALDAAERRQHTARRRYSRVPALRTAYARRRCTRNRT